MSKTIDNLSNAFAASLSFGFNDKVADYSLSREDSVIEKNAGITIYQPTIDNIEMFIRKYVLNELSFMPKLADIGIQVVPSRFNTAQKDYVDEASGVVTAKINDAVLEFPFIITDGELVPFDIIQLDKQRVPYSRENLKKVVMGILNQAKSTAPVKEFDPYVKVEKNVINPTSTIGFLGDVLRIRDKYTNRTGGNGGSWITANEDIDNLLEKVANIQEMTEEKWDQLANLIREKVSSDVVENLEKEAAEIEDTDFEKVAETFSKVKDIQFVDASTLANGTSIAFPEIHDNEISMTNGIVIADYIGFAGWQPKPTKIVVSQDGRVKILRNGDRFLCLKSDTTKFSLPLKELDTVNQKDIIMAFDGNKAFYPCSVNYIARRIVRITSEGNPVESSAVSATPVDITSPAPANLSNINILHIIPVSHNSNIFSVLSDNGLVQDDDSILNEHTEFKLVPLKDTKFHELPYNEFVKRKAEELGINELATTQFISKHEVASWRDKMINSPGAHTRMRVEDKANIVLCTDPNTKVLVIKGVITGYLKDKKDLDNMIESVPEAEIGKQAMEKEALFGFGKKPDKMHASYNVKQDKVVFSPEFDNWWNELSPDKKNEINASIPKAIEAAKLPGKMGPSSIVAGIYDKAYKDSIRKNTVKGFRVEKTASQNEYIEIRTASKEDRTYNMKLVHADKSKKVFKLVNREFKSLHETDVRQILKALGYDIPKISEIMGKARNGDFVKYDLPVNATPDKVVGGQVSGVVGDKLKKIRKTLFDSNISDALAAEVLGSLLAGTIGSGVIGAGALDAVSKFAEESEALCTAFEKLAMENQSESLLKVAKLLATAAHFDNKVCDIIKGTQYPKMREIVADIVDMRDTLEKVATDLVELKYEQYNNRNHIVHPSYISGAVKQLDNMFKIASVLNRI